MDILALINHLRDQIAANITLLIPSPEADLILGCVLGINNFDPDFYNQLKVTGLVHVAVVSGYNISVVTNATLRMFKMVPRLPRVLLAFAIIGFYILLTGANPPSVRAGIMTVLSLSAGFFGRENWSLYTLFLAAVIMLLFEPSLFTNLSFQLSFAATLGIILFDNSFNHLIKIKSLPSVLTADLATSLAAQVFVLPIILYNFGSLSLVSPLANMFSLWLIPIVTYLGFALAIISLISTSLATVVGWVAFAFSFAFVILTEFFASFPFAYFLLDRKSTSLSVGICFIILAVALVARRLGNRKVVGKPKSETLTGFVESKIS